MPKILIVEDNEESRDLLAGRLQCSGFAVAMAEDGKMGIAMVQSEKPDLVLMDMNMPDMDGLEATRQIKLLGGENVPVIALIEEMMPQGQEPALGADFADSHKKPIEFTDLLQQIEALLHSSTAREEAK
jgi:two-component system, cell cycle response regulator DivK